MNEANRAKSESDNRKLLKKELDNRLLNVVNEMSRIDALILMLNDNGNQFYYTSTESSDIGDKFIGIKKVSDKLNKFFFQG